MESTYHSLSELFAQLGLPDAPDAIEAFIDRHAPLPPTVALVEATFWSPSQADFLRSGLARDADWAVPVDSLDVQLRRETGMVLVFGAWC